MPEIKKYTSDMREKVLLFFGEVFAETGKVFEPEGRHSAFADVERNFAGFWCLFDDDRLVGTSAVKRLDHDTCELKGLYLFEKYHGQKLGYELADTALEFARRQGFKRMVLDTVSTYEKAVRLYVKMGFVSTERYNDNDRADIFMVKNL